MTGNNTKQDGETGNNTGQKTHTPAIDDRIESELRDLKSEVPNLVEFSGEGQDNSVEAAINKWFADDDDVRSETWVSRDQAKAMAILLDIQNLYESHEHSDKYTVINNMDYVIDHLLNLQISLDGRGRKQQTTVLGGRVSNKMEQNKNNPDNDGKKLKSWS